MVKTHVTVECEYLPMLVELLGDNRVRVGELIGRSNSCVSKAMTDKRCTLTMELAAKAVVNEMTSAARVLEPRAALRAYFQSKTVLDLTVDDIELLGKTVREIIKEG